MIWALSVYWLKTIEREKNWHSWNDSIKSCSSLLLLLLLFFFLLVLPLVQSERKQGSILFICTENLIKMSTNCWWKLTDFTEACSFLQASLHKHKQAFVNATGLTSRGGPSRVIRPPIDALMYASFEAHSTQKDLWHTHAPTNREIETRCLFTWNS